MKIFYAFWYDIGFVIIYITVVVISTSCFVFHRSAFCPKGELYIYIYFVRFPHLTMMIS